MPARLPAGHEPKRGLGLRCDMAAPDNPFWSQRQRDELALEHARPADLAEAEEEEEEQSFDLFGDDPPIEDLGNEGR